MLDERDISGGAEVVECYVWPKDMVREVALGLFVAGPFAAAIWGRGTSCADAVQYAVVDSWAPALAVFGRVLAFDRGWGLFSGGGHAYSVIVGDVFGACWDAVVYRVLGRRSLSWSIGLVGEHPLTWYVGL